MLDKGDRTIDVEFASSMVRLRLPQDEYISNVIAESRKFYEQDLLEELFDLPLPPGVVIDVGANIGNHTLFFSKVMHRRVVAFEPFAPAARYLEASVDDNGVSSLVELRRCGLSDSFRWSHLDIDPENWGRTRMREQSSGATPLDSEAVLFGPLDALIPAELPVALVKIDVEGSEAAVLEGMRDTLSRHRPALSIELLDLAALESAVSQLSALNYGCTAVRGRSNNYIFLHRQAHADAFDLAQAHRVRRLQRITERHGGVLPDHHFSRIADELDRLKGMNSALSRAAYDREKRLEARERAADDLRLRLDRATSAYSDLFYAIPKYFRRKQPYPRDLRKTLRGLKAPPAASRSGRLRQMKLPYLLEEVAVERPVRIGIASIPSRAASLISTLESLRSQADEIFVSLNGYDSVPDHPFGKSVKFELNKNVGDLAKFRYLTDDFRGYYFTCDDDIQYPPYFVKSVVYYLKKYGYVAAGWHGSVLKENFHDYYDRGSRDVKTFYGAQHSESFVHILGTGCMGFDADKVRPDQAVFESPNMADVYFAKFAQKARLPMLVVPHDRGEALDINRFNRGFETNSISLASIRKDTQANELNVRERVNALVKSISWEIHVPEPRGLRLLFIGRFATDRWVKGGIFKSCHLMVRQLEAIGHRVQCVEIDSPLAALLEAARGEFDLGFVYTGDQSAQDFFNVREIIRSRSESRFPMYFNLSYDGGTEQNEEIAHCAGLLGTRDGLLAFTEAARDALSALTGRPVMVVPKTIDRPSSATAALPMFSETRGVFCGDVSKLLNSRRTPDAAGFFEALSKVVDLKDIHFVRQYEGEPLPGWMRGVTVHSYSENIHAVIQTCRAYVHLNKTCTFEMLPVETMFLGVPVAYVAMPHSLDTYVGDAGLRFSSPQDLERRLPLLLSDENLWLDRRSRALERAEALHWQRTSEQLKLEIVAAFEASRA